MVEMQNLAQILPDGGISATWLFGIMTAIIGYLINAKLNNLERTLTAHGSDIQEIKLAQTSAKATYEANYHATIARLDHMDEEFESLMKAFQAKTRFINGDEK